MSDAAGDAGRPRQSRSRETLDPGGPFTHSFRVDSPLLCSLRICFVAGALGLWFWSQRAISRKAPAGNAIRDMMHEWTAPLHAWLEARPRAANGTLIVTSACIDLFGLFLLGSAILGPTLRPFLALILVFVLRQFCQLTFTLPAPERMIWRHPGFPSLLVTYGTSNDFFFSGHTACAVVGALEIARIAPEAAGVAALAVAAVEALTVIVLRAHYTIDVFAAIFAAWGMDMLAARIAPHLDALLR